MFTMESIVISEKIQYKHPLLKTKSFAASVSVHSIIIASIAYFMISHPIVLPKPEKAIAISLANFSQSEGDIHRIESVVPQPQPMKPQPSPAPITKQPNIQKTAKPTVTTPEKTQLLTPSVSPEASAPLASTPMPTSSLPPKSIDSPQSTSSAPVNELPRNPVSDKQIGGAALGHIRAMIENAISYPAIARKLRLEGVVLVTFILKSDGTVETAHVKSSSGSNVLDTKAIQTILSLSGDYPALGKTFELSIPIAFNLQKS